MRISKGAWRVIAVVVAAGFYAIALRSDVYHATSPQSLGRILFGSGVPEFAHPWWLSLHIWVRKAYSVVAFAIVGWCAHKALDPTPHPFRRAAILVGTYSAAIEVGQKIFVGYEPPILNLLDVACGALGGWLAVAADRAVTRMRSARPCPVFRASLELLAAAATERAIRIRCSRTAANVDIDANTAASMVSARSLILASPTRATNTISCRSPHPRQQFNIAPKTDRCSQLAARSVEDIPRRLGQVLHASWALGKSGLRCTPHPGTLFRRQRHRGGQRRLSSQSRSWRILGLVARSGREWVGSRLCQHRVNEAR